MTVPAKIKLTYFPIKARAESIRLALAIGGINFEDERITFETFKSLKDTYPFRQLPVMTIDGKVSCQSRALLRYIGKLAGLYPTDPLAALHVDAVIEALADIGSKIAASVHEVLNGIYNLIE